MVNQALDYAESQLASNYPHSPVPSRSSASRILIAVLSSFAKREKAAGRGRIHHAPASFLPLPSLGNSTQLLYATNLTRTALTPVQMGRENV